MKELVEDLEIIVFVGLGLAIYSVARSLKRDFFSPSIRRVK